MYAFLNRNIPFNEKFIELINEGIEEMKKIRAAIDSEIAKV